MKSDIMAGMGDMQKMLMQQMQQMQQGFQQAQLQAGPPQWQQQQVGQQQLQAGWAAQQQQAQPPQHGIPAYTRAAPGTLLPSGKYAPPAGSTWTASGAPICNFCKQEGHISSACPNKAATGSTQSAGTPPAGANQGQAANQGLYQYLTDNLTNPFNVPNLPNLISMICDAMTATNPNNKPGLTDTSVKMGSEALTSDDDRDAHESRRNVNSDHHSKVNEVW